MASINFGPFGDNGYLFPPINLLSLAESLNPFKPSQNPSFFASISSSKNSAQKPSSKHSTKKPDDAPEDPEKHRKLLQSFYWECHNRPDHRHTPEVEKILTDTVFENKDNPTSEEVEENEEWWEEFRSSPVVRFIQRSEEIADSLNQEELAANAEPYRKEDAKMWKAVPNVIGLDGRPMPRKAIRTDEESDAKFWDFARQFFFGLWGFRQRPYPPGKPIDVSQAIGYKRLETRYYDFIMKTSGWFYKDRLGHSRGPMELIQLKTAWGGGIIDKHTFVWGDDMDEWAPIGMVYGLERAIASWDVRLGAAATAFLHKLQKGIPPWVPLKGHENKTYKQLQEEAVESKRRDLAVLEANGGVWPGVRIPSHSMFLWASGSELSSILEADHMPNKCIPKDLRIQLAKVIPGLRPWEVLSLEQAMDKIMFGGQWYRDELGSYTTGIPFVEEWNEDVLEYLKGFTFISSLFCESMEESIPGFGKFLDKYDEQSEALRRRRLEEKKKAEAKKAWDEALGVKSTIANENAENERDPGENVSDS